MMHTLGQGDQDLAEYVRHVENDLAATVREMAEHFPVMVGEWCVDTKSGKAATLRQAERVDYYRALFAAHMRAWRPATAWTYWSGKHLVDTPDMDVWDFGKAVDLGYLPRNLADDGTDRY
jgi:glucan 1,3-beta-glucosidase